MLKITILGATGSIGCNTLDVIALHPESFEVFALTANQRVDDLFVLCQKFLPRYAVVRSADAALELQKKFKENNLSTEVLFGEEALCAVASDTQVDIVMAAIVGAAGLAPTIAAAEAGKRLLLANKESLVVAGQLLLDAVARGGATLLPIDSEHNAIFQCLNPHDDLVTRQREVRRLILTASGGPFRKFSTTELLSVTPAQACKHPNWSMGQKISVDSATLMNKGLEVIEAFWLFGLAVDKIDVLVHPQSVIHSMVEYIDGSVLAQLGQPDMRTPIAYGLAWPKRMNSGVAPLDFLTIGQLDFEKPDIERFPALRLAYQAIEVGGTAPTILNAANEIAVAAFLSGKIGFLAISQVIEQALHGFSVTSVESLSQLLVVDQEVRQFVTQLVR